MLYTLDSEWSPKFFTQLTALLDSTSPHWLNSCGCLHQDHITLQIRNINLVVKECGLHFTEAYFPLKMSINLVSSDTTQLTPKNAALTPCSLSHCLLTTVAFIAERKGYAKKLLPTSPTYLLLLLARMVAHFDRFTLVVWK